MMGFFSKIIKKSKILILKKILLNNNTNYLISIYERMKITDLISQ